MKKPLLTKRQRALQELEHASHSLNHALSLLGGRTRHKPRMVTRQFIARQYLESLVTRLSVVRDLVMISGIEESVLVEAAEFVASNPRPVRMSPAHGEAYGKGLADSIGAISPTFPRDDFEALYDKERKPQC